VGKVLFSRSKEPQAARERVLGVGTERTLGLNGCIPTNILKDLAHLYRPPKAVHRL
jgi:hypothetical protein